MRKTIGSKKQSDVAQLLTVLDTLAAPPAPLTDPDAPRKVDRNEVCDACFRGDLQCLKNWQQENRLPDLTLPDKFGFFAHERAAENGRLAVLSWLVLESGQTLDLTSSQNYSLRWAAYRNHVEVVDWILQHATNFRKLALNHATLDADWVEVFTSDVQSFLELLAWFQHFLQEQGVSESRQECFLASETCRRAFHAGIVQTTSDLERLLQQPDMTSRRRL